jgi:hypothetical protein
MRTNMANEMENIIFSFFRRLDMLSIYALSHTCSHLLAVVWIAHNVCLPITAAVANVDDV